MEHLRPGSRADRPSLRGLLKPSAASAHQGLTHRLVVRSARDCQASEQQGHRPERLIIVHGIARGEAPADIARRRSASSYAGRASGSVLGLPTGRTAPTPGCSLPHPRPRILSTQCCASHGSCGSENTRGFAHGLRTELRRAAEVSIESAAREPASSHDILNGSCLETSGCNQGGGGASQNATARSLLVSSRVGLAMLSHGRPSDGSCAGVSCRREGAPSPPDRGPRKPVHPRPGQPAGSGCRSSLGQAEGGCSASPAAASRRMP